MTEPRITQDLLKETKARLLGTGAVTIKHSDQFTAGIPDLSVSAYGVTTWVECKLLRDGLGSLTRELKEVQLVTLVRLERATEGRAWIWIWVPGKRRGEKMTYVVRPSVELARRQAQLPFVPATHAEAQLPGYDHSLLAAMIVQDASKRTQP